MFVHTAQSNSSYVLLNNNIRLFLLQHQSTDEFIYVKRRKNVITKYQQHIQRKDSTCIIKNGMPKSIPIF